MNIKNVSTLGELREATKHMSDNTPLIIYKSDMERQGYMKNVYIEECKTVEKIKETWDRFDGDTYYYSVYEDSNNGDMCLKIH